MAGQPNLPGVFTFDVTSKFIHSVAGAPIPDTGAPETNVIDPGELVHVHTTVTLTGPFALILATALNNPAVGLKVTHHIENLHNGARIEQAGGTSFAVGPAGVTIISPPFNLPVTAPPAGATETPYKVVTTVQAGGPLAGLVAGFIDGPILMAVS